MHSHSVCRDVDNILKSGDSSYYRPTPDVAHGEGENQWMNFYLVDSDTPTPVYI